MSRAKAAIQKTKSGKITHLSKITQSATSFRPTQPMLTLLNLLRDKNYQISIRAAFEELGADRTQFYRWADVPGFSEWWHEQSERHFARHLPQVYGAMHRAAVDPDGTAADRKLLLDKFDKGFQAKDQAAAPAPTIRVDVLDLMRAMIEGVAAAVPRGAPCFAAPLTALPMVEGQAHEVPAEDA